MTLRPHEDVILPADDAARLRRVLAACSDVLARADANAGPQLAAAAQDAAEAAGLSRAPGALAYHVNLAIDTIDFAGPAGRTR
jgi:hypothetical protein